MTIYTFKRWFRSAARIEASDTLSLRRECRRRLGWRKSARYSYVQIGCNSFRIQNRLGWTVADVFLAEIIA